MPKNQRKRTAQLDREIAEALTHSALRRAHTKRHHSTRHASTDAWDVAMDAILEHDPERAAKIVLDIRKEHGIMVPTPQEFSDALRAAPTGTRQKFFELLEPKPKPGKPEFEEKAPGVMTLYVPEHGFFSAPILTYHRYKRMPRAKLLERVLQVYEGTGERGEKASHWRGYDKDYLAMIVADAFGTEEQ